MRVETHFNLAPMTSFKTGGIAEKAIILDRSTDFVEALKSTEDQPVWLLGYGSNSLISDKGLPGTTILLRGGSIQQEDTMLIADGGVWWDDLVQYAISHNLWGIEFMSAIPGGVSAAVVGNIAAYGQAVADSLVWVEAYDLTTHTSQTITAQELGFVYRSSQLLQANRSLVVLRAAFNLSNEPTKELEYEAALSIARAEAIDLTTLSGRRQAIHKARESAGSLWDYRDETADRTAGSFFRNPLVDSAAAERIMSYDETGKSLELLKKMNQVHGGVTSRVSAAHVLLAAGFTRGQSWFDGNVRLHTQHVLKIENAGHATSQQIYDVAQEIISTAKLKLDVELDPEIRFLGDFTSP